MVTFKSYVRKDIEGSHAAKFPNLQVSFAQEVQLPQNKQLVMDKL